MSTGRPRSELTDEAVALIVKCVEEGLTPEAAARVAEVRPSSMRAHRRRHPEFATAIKRAESSRQRTWVGMIAAAAPKNWTAAAWLLERTDPDTWARRDPMPRQERRVASDDAMFE